MNMRNVFLSALLLLSAHCVQATMDLMTFEQELSECETQEEQTALLVKYPYFAQQAVTIFTVGCPDDCEESVKEALHKHMNALKDAVLQGDREAIAASRDAILEVVQGFEDMKPSIRMSLLFKEVSEPRLDVMEVDNVVALVSVCTPSMYQFEDWKNLCQRLVDMVSEIQDSQEESSAEAIFNFMIDSYNLRIQSQE